MALAAIAYPLLWSGAFRSLLSSGLLLGVFLLVLLLVVFWRFVAHHGLLSQATPRLLASHLYPVQGL
jgi:hypothetical protein